jgi:hypothetical protein
MDGLRVGQGEAIGKPHARRGTHRRMGLASAASASEPRILRAPDNAAIARDPSAPVAKADE